MMLPFSFQKGNKAAGCEDAPPVSNIKFSVVCDGLGGAGSTKHKVEEAGTVVMRTSGYLGSRVVADSVTDFYDVNYERIANILFSNGNSVIALQAVIEELKSTIKTALSTKMTKLGIDPMLTRKKALKIFPTTLASALYFQDSEKLKILAIWAGDSRVYVLSPTKGLQLLSLDDAVNADREMNSASEMNNCISAGNAFRLNYSIFEMDEPGIVFCCSDGCFDYLPSPLHFEWLVLQTILSCVPNVTSDNLGEAFANSVRDSVYQSIGDDTTMAGTIYKINSTNELRETFAVRMEQFGQLNVCQGNITLKYIGTNIKNISVVDNVTDVTENVSEHLRENTLEYKNNIVRNVSFTTKSKDHSVLAHLGLLMENKKEAMKSTSGMFKQIGSNFKGGYENRTKNLAISKNNVANGFGNFKNNCKLFWRQAAKNINQLVDYIARKIGRTK